MATIEQAKNIIRKTINIKKYVNIPLLLWGHTGGGKTEVVEQIAEELNYNLSILNLANQSPEDLLGEPKRNEPGYHKPDWFKEEEGKPTIYFLDEINRGPKYVLQAMFNFIKEGRLHNHRIRPEDVVISAANPSEAEYIVTDFDDGGFIARFSHLKIMPTKEEFLKYLDENVDGSGLISQALIKSPSLYQQNHNFNIPEQRAWNRSLKMVDILLKHLSDDELKSFGSEMIKGLIGYDATSIVMMSWNQGQEFEWDKIKDMKEYPFQKDELEKIHLVNLSLRKKLNGNYFWKLDKKERDMIFKFIDFCPEDMKYKVVIDIEKAIYDNFVDELTNDQIEKYHHILTKNVE